MSFKWLSQNVLHELFCLEFLLQFFFCSEDDVLIPQPTEEISRTTSPLLKEFQYHVNYANSSTVDDSESEGDIQLKQFHKLLTQKTAGLALLEEFQKYSKLHKNQSNQYDNREANNFKRYKFDSFIKDLQDSIFNVTVEEWNSVNKLMGNKTKLKSFWSALSNLTVSEEFKISLSLLKNLRDYERVQYKPQESLKNKVVGKVTPHDQKAAYKSLFLMPKKPVKKELEYRGNQELNSIRYLHSASGISKSHIGESKGIFDVGDIKFDADGIKLKDVGSSNNYYKLLRELQEIPKKNSKQKNKKLRANNRHQVKKFKHPQEKLHKKSTKPNKTKEEIPTIIVTSSSELEIPGDTNKNTSHLPIIVFHDGSTSSQTTGSDTKTNLGLVNATSKNEVNLAMPTPVVFISEFLQRDLHLNGNARFKTPANILNNERQYDEYYDVNQDETNTPVVFLNDTIQKMEKYTKNADIIIKPDITSDESQKGRHPGNGLVSNTPVVFINTTLQNQGSVKQGYKTNFNTMTTIVKTTNSMQDLAQESDKEEKYKPYDISTTPSAVIFVNDVNEKFKSLGEINSDLKVDESFESQTKVFPQRVFDVDNDDLKFKKISAPKVFEASNTRNENSDSAVQTKGYKIEIELNNQITPSSEGRELETRNQTGQSKTEPGRQAAGNSYELGESIQLTPKSEGQVEKVEKEIESKNSTVVNENKHHFERKVMNSAIELENLEYFSPNEELLERQKLKTNKNEQNLVEKTDSLPNSDEEAFEANSISVQSKNEDPLEKNWQSALNKGQELIEIKTQPGLNNDKKFKEAKDQSLPNKDEGDMEKDNQSQNKGDGVLLNDTQSVTNKGEGDLEAKSQSTLNKNEGFMEVKKQPALNKNDEVIEAKNHAAPNKGEEEMETNKQVSLNKDEGDFEARKQMALNKNVTVAKIQPAFYEKNGVITVNKQLESTKDEGIKGENIPLALNKNVEEINLYSNSVPSMNKGSPETSSHTLSEATLSAEVNEMKKNDQDNYKLDINKKFTNNEEDNIRENVYADTKNQSAINDEKTFTQPTMSPSNQDKKDEKIVLNDNSLYSHFVHNSIKAKFPEDSEMQSKITQILLSPFVSENLKVKDIKSKEEDADRSPRKHYRSHYKTDFSTFSKTPVIFIKQNKEKDVSYEKEMETPTGKLFKFFPFI